MPDYRRADVKGGTYFFTVNTYRRQPLLVHDAVRAALREAIDKVRATLPFVVSNEGVYSTAWGLSEQDNEHYGE